MNVPTNNDRQCTIALAALENVIDPEIGLNVVDLGLIYRVTFGNNDPGEKITVLMTLTTPYCPAASSITGGVERALETTFSGRAIEVELTFEPPWSYDRISEHGKKYLSGDIC
jgi:metal-sulfur cluster biosynthetic enzyme